MKPNLDLLKLFLSRVIRLGENSPAPPEPPALQKDGDLIPRDDQGRPILGPATLTGGTISGVSRPSIDVLISAGAIVRVPRVSLGNRALVERLQAIEELAIQAENLIGEGPDKDLRAAITAERESSRLGQDILREILPVEATDLIGYDESMSIIAAMKSGPGALPDEMRPDFTAPDPKPGAESGDPTS